MARDSREDYQNYTTMFGSVWDVVHKIFAAIVTLATAKNLNGTNYMLPTLPTSNVRIAAASTEAVAAQALVDFVDVVTITERPASNPTVIGVDQILIAWFVTPTQPYQCQIKSTPHDNAVEFARVLAYIKANNLIEWFPTAVVDGAAVTLTYGVAGAAYNQRPVHSNIENLAVSDFNGGAQAFEQLEKTEGVGAHLVDPNTGSKLRIKEVVAYSSVDWNTASATLHFTIQPANGNHLRIGGMEFAFVTGTPSQQYHVQIGATLQDTMVNLTNKINQDTMAYNRCSVDYESDDTGYIFYLYAKMVGSAGNNITLQVEPSGATIVQPFQGGTDFSEVLPEYALEVTPIGPNGLSVTKLVAGEARTPIVESGVLLEEVLSLTPRALNESFTFDFDGLGKNLKLEMLVVNDTGSVYDVDVNFSRIFEGITKGQTTQYLGEFGFDNDPSKNESSDANHLTIHFGLSSEPNDANPTLAPRVAIRITETSRNAKLVGRAASDGADTPLTTDDDGNLNTIVSGPVLLAPPDLQNFGAFFLINTSLSDVINLDGRTPQQIFMPAAWTAADIAFQVSFDGAAYVPLYDDAGVRIKATVAVNRAIHIDGAKLKGVQSMKLESIAVGGSAAVVQTAERFIKVIAV
jgi:hypothetical protein